MASDNRICFIPKPNTPTKITVQTEFIAMCLCDERRGECRRRRRRRRRWWWWECMIWKLVSVVNSHKRHIHNRRIIGRLFVLSLLAHNTLFVQSDIRSSCINLEHSFPLIGYFVMLVSSVPKTELDFLTFASLFIACHRSGQYFHPSNPTVHIGWTIAFQNIQ